MQFSLATSVLFALSAASSALAVAQTCALGNTPGECLATAQCSSAGGTSHSENLCPGDADIQCCTWNACSGGQCGPGTLCAGSYSSGGCPGGPFGDVGCCAGQPATLSGYSFIQSARAAQIAQEVKARGLPRQACLCAISTALTESSLQMYANSGVADSYNYGHDAVGSDHDSVGLFQQRVAYYPIDTGMSASKSTSAFLDKLIAISGWETGDVASLDQQVQVSAYPDAYEPNVGPAGDICSALGF